jgi:hypothetical protein
MSKINFYGVLNTSKGSTFYGFDCKEKRDKWLGKPLPNASKEPGRYRPIKIALKMKKGQALEFAANGKVSVVGDPFLPPKKKKAVASKKKERATLPVQSDVTTTPPPAVEADSTALNLAM